MRGKLIGYGTLIVLTLWLILSYVPVELPQVALPISASGLRWLATLVVGLFVVIQLVIVARTPTILRASRQQSPPLPRVLSASGEFFWTLLPLLATLALVAVSIF